MTEKDIKLGCWCKAKRRRGIRNGLIIGIKWFKKERVQIYFPGSEIVESVNFDQVIKVGNKLQDSESGLD